MQRILAIEADVTRKQILTALVRGHVKARLTVVDSVPQAVAALDECAPDVVLVPMLLAPNDEAQLMAHIRRLESPHVQTLTMPALDTLAEPRQEGRRRLGFGRRRHQGPHEYDPQMVAAQIRGGLERARAAKEEHEAALAHARWCAERDGTDVSLVRLRPVIQPLIEQPGEERRRARRIPRHELPWLEAVRMPWGADLDIVNISSTGLLVESTTKLSVGTTYDLQLAGTDTSLLTKARFVRSDVGRVDQHGVRYHAAAIFERPVDLTTGRLEGSGSGHPLTDLAAAVMADRLNRPEPAELRFASGLCKLLGARDVLVRESPVTPADGSESIYFHVRGEGRAKRILQVLLDPGRVLTTAEFRILKAAASLMAAILELEEFAEAPLDIAASAQSVA